MKGRLVYPLTVSFDLLNREANRGYEISSATSCFAVFDDPTLATVPLDSVNYSRLPARQNRGEVGEPNAEEQQLSFCPSFQS